MSVEATEVWSRCLVELEDQLSKPQIHTWLHPLHPVIDEGALRLYAPNAFIRDWVRTHYSDSIRDAVSKWAGDQSLIVWIEL